MKKGKKYQETGENENMKRLDLNKPVQKLCAEYPELIDILRELGFSDITKPGMLATAGRFMTLPKGAAMKKIDMDIVKRTLEGRGYEITDGEGEK